MENYKPNDNNHKDIEAQLSNLAKGELKVIVWWRKKHDKKTTRKNKNNKG